jgi:hypothetical protein
MARSQVPVVQLERLPHRHAIIRLRQAYHRLRQLEVTPQTDQKPSETVAQEVTKCKQ